LQFLTKLLTKIFSAKKPDKSVQQMQSNQWVTNGTLGSKDAILVFRTSVLAASAAPSSTNAFDHPDLYSSETPSASSTCTELSKVGNEKSYVTAMALPQNVRGDRRIDTETFNFIEKKTKKRSLESSSSTSSSSSLNSSNSMTESQLGNAESSGDLAAGTSKDSDSENKENIIVAPIDKDEMPAALFNITYKFLNTETRLLRKILHGHGLVEVGHDANDFNLLWTGNQLKPDMLRNLSQFQRINHFPR
jgi:tubulin polyglutamylase TTLL5